MAEKFYPDDNWICECGSRLELVTVETWIDETNATGLVSGLWSCPTPGCSGNIKEFYEKRLQAMLKLTDDDKKILGLWCFFEKEQKPKRSRFGRWLHGIFHV